jgi:hypothetical protein
LNKDNTMRIKEAGKYANREGVSKKAAGSFLASGWFHLALVLILLLPALSAYGQFESASVLGYTHDATGAAIPNANVTLTNVATGITQTKQTDSEGKYEFPSVQIGNYQIVAEAGGFERTRTETFTVLTNARQRVDVTMKAGSVSTEVTVTSAAQLLDTD